MGPDTASVVRHAAGLAAALAAWGLAAAPGPARAAGSDDRAALRTTLTEIGAERAGNADGTIPPWTGGLTVPPPGFVQGSGTRPDPFAGEAKRFSIDASSLEAHAARLTEGTKALLRRYPGFRLDVYPTHRTAAFPRAVTEATVARAGDARAANGGLSLAGVRAAYPFPVPRTGHEAMWNHLVRYSYVCARKKISAWYVEPSGRVTLTSRARVSEEYPYWDPARPAENVYFRFRIAYDAPARRAGEAFMLVDPVDAVERGRRAWMYLPGQRRVRLAPDLAYDTPNAATNGAQTFDDALLFNGKMDRFEFTLLGKREIYVPYNAYRAVYGATAKELLGPRFLEPSLVRWELHRVWVVEARLAPGKRHLYSRRVFYLDEDSWAALLSDQYDGQGELYRVGMALMAPSYDVPAPWADPFLHLDLASGAYAINGWPGADGWLRPGACEGDAAWSPEALAGAGVR